MPGTITSSTFTRASGSDTWLSAVGIWYLKLLPFKFLPLSTECMTINQQNTQNAELVFPPASFCRTKPICLMLADSEQCHEVLACTNDRQRAAALPFAGVVSFHSDEHVAWRQPSAVTYGHLHIYGNTNPLCQAWNSNSSPVLLPEANFACLPTLVTRPR